MAFFPMMIRLEDKPVLVIGAGEEGTKKIKILHEFGCIITLIALRAEREAEALANEILYRSFTDSDITDNYVCIVAATDDKRLNRRISDLASERKIPVNVVDDMELCTFIFPAIIKEKDLVCAVSSGGKSPVTTQYVKKRIQENLPKEIGTINDLMGAYREQVKKEIPNAADRRKALADKLDELLQGKDK